VKALAALLLALAAIDEGRAATAYVTDELVLGVYAAATTQGPRLATLHSGASVETLSISGDATQVRLLDGTSGWVKTAYLTTTEPATARLKLLQDELDRSRATGPGLAEAAARAELQRLKRELAQRPAPTAPAAGGAATRLPTWGWVSAIIGALACGFWLGYATLARRIKYKFGGIKVY
jgi:uncharacterized protein YgiM (DUF1202 family)